MGARPTELEGRKRAFSQCLTPQDEASLRFGASILVEWSKNRASCYRDVMREGDVKRPRSASCGNWNEDSDTADAAGIISSFSGRSSPNCATFSLTSPGAAPLPACPSGGEACMPETPPVTSLVTAPLFAPLLEAIEQRCSSYRSEYLSPRERCVLSPLSPSKADVFEELRRLADAAQHAHINEPRTLDMAPESTTISAC